MDAMQVVVASDGSFAKMSCSRIGFRQGSRGMRAQFPAFLAAEIGVQFGIFRGASPTPAPTRMFGAHMTTAQVTQERRAAQRFEFNLPVRIRANQTEHCGCTQDVSGRGVFLLVDATLPEGCQVEMDFFMPPEVTLTEGMRVRCCGRILRVQPLPHQQKFGIAVSIESYSCLAAEDSGGNAAFDRIVCLHDRRETSPEPQLSSSKLF